MIKRFCLTLIAPILTSMFMDGLQAQTSGNNSKKVYLDNTEQFSVTSDFVRGENYSIQVGLPADYSGSKKSYPVLYVLDGDKSFGMTKEIKDWLVWSNEIRDVIVVGISYGQGTATWWEKRARDYTQYMDTVYYYYPNAGGAGNFLKFIRNELFPLINNKYRTIQDSTAIMGISFGGLLCSYALFAQPDLFKSYIIISPSLFWNDNSILKTEAEYFGKHKDLDKTVYMAYGSLDSKDWTINPSNELIQNIQAHNYADFKFTSEIFEGETHISVYPIALTHGLKDVFKR
ncbi:MAG: alpha/beta hydrolase-fold protein [Bacteroidales bacterium]|jgi:hypothetical protein